MRSGAPTARWVGGDASRRQPARTRGFTLIEMVVVVAIVGILASAAMPLATLARQRARESELREDLRVLRTAIDAYKHAYDSGHIQKRSDATGYPPNLDVLVSGVKDAANGGGAMMYFLRRIPRDPFAEPGVTASKSWSLRSYASSPDAPTPGVDVFDIHSRSNALGMDGTSYSSW